MLLLFLHYIFTMSSLFQLCLKYKVLYYFSFCIVYLICLYYLCIIFGIIFCCVYNKVAMFDLFQQVSKCIWNNFIDII